MPRIAYADTSKMSADIRAMVDNAPINVVRMLAGASPAVFKAMSDFSGAFFTASRLPADLREVAILRAGYIANSDYETWQHESIARSVGMSDAQVAAIKADRADDPALTPAQKAVLVFANEVVIDARASDAALAAVREHLADDQVIDLVLVTGLYMTVSRLLENTGVERDAAPISAAFIQNIYD